MPCIHHHHHLSTRHIACMSSMTWFLLKRPRNEIIQYLSATTLSSPISIHHSWQLVCIVTPLNHCYKGQWDVRIIYVLRFYHYTTIFDVLSPFSRTRQQCMCVRGCERACGWMIGIDLICMKPSVIMEDCLVAY